MASSFFALLDDIAVLAKAAAASIDDVVAGAGKASAKAAGVVIDDAAVTPQYVHGISPKRELPVIWRITRGSLLNKAIIIAAVMPLSIWAPWIFPWLLLIGGSYLAYEGAEKIWHWVHAKRGAHGGAEITHADADEPAHEDPAPASPEQIAAPALERTPTDEKQMVASAVRTDLVLSTEIMLISLANVDADSWLPRLAILVLVAIVMTAGVYGTVALLVKMDDAGLWMMRRRAGFAQTIGHGLVRAMPLVFRALSVVGVVAMLWVGGHILLVNLAEVGVPWPYDLLHALEHAIGGPAIVAWLINSLCSAICGLAWGAVLVGATGLFRRK
ncbi:MAG: DUF808 domain-containing protein [Leucobacter sp.]|nr:DUF808 domain-containing protein [Leucobacter sp.]